MRECYSRHRVGCKCLKKSNPKKVFGCGCPLYGRFTVKNPVTGEILFDYTGSLAKHGVTSVEMAEKLFDQWTMQYLSGDRKPAHQERAALTIDEAVNQFLCVIAASKGLTYDPTLPYTRVDIIKRNRAVLGGLPSFCAERGITHLEQIQTAHLSAFQLTWPGKRGKDVATGKFYIEPKTKNATSKWQEHLRAFFSYMKEQGSITRNPAHRRLLPTVKVPKQEIKIFTPDQVNGLFKKVQQIFPEPEGTNLTAFILLQMTTGLRISDVVSFPRNFKGLSTTEQRKTKGVVWLELHAAVRAALDAVTPESEACYFWSGTSLLRSRCGNWSLRLLKAFRAAGIPSGMSSKTFRSTLGTMLRTNSGLDVAQHALGHTNQSTTAKFYADLNTPEQALKTNEAKKELYEKHPLFRVLKGGKMKKAS